MKKERRGFAQGKDNFFFFISLDLQFYKKVKKYFFNKRSAKFIGKLKSFEKMCVAGSCEP